jgi:hypothetical protein
MVVGPSAVENPAADQSEVRGCQCDPPKAEKQSPKGLYGLLRRPPKADSSQ